MAQIIPAPQLAQLSGATHRGSQTVAYPRRNKTFARIQRGTPWRGSPAQVKVTQFNKAATSAFGSITDAQRDTWRAYALNFFKVHMGVACQNTDLEMFISTNFHRQLNEEPISSTAPLSRPTPFDFVLLESHCFNSSPALSVKFTHTSTDYDSSWFLLRASHSFKSPGRKARLCDYRQAGSVEHYTLFPVQPSPQTCYVPLTPLKHTGGYYIWIACMLLSSDYYKGTQLESHSQLQLIDCIWNLDPGHSIILNHTAGAIDFKISNTLVARLFQDGTLHLKGEVEECGPALATPAHDYIYFDTATSEIRLAYKTKTTPGFKTILSLGPDGNLTTFGEIHEFSDLSAHSETLYFHPYCTPRKLQISVDRQTPALIFFVDDAPQNTIHWKEVYEYEL